jgi:glycyl-tRNA synthetase beta subunit
MSRPQTTLLIELGTEELPPKALQKLSVAFGSTLSESSRRYAGRLFAIPQRPRRGCRI